jgi:hypothetical protein
VPNIFVASLFNNLYLHTGSKLIRKDMDVNEHERLSNSNGN